jgi:hypothetical protein
VGDNAAWVSDVFTEAFVSRKYHFRYPSEPTVIAAATPYACISITLIFVSSIKSSEQHVEIAVFL